MPALARSRRGASLAFAVALSLVLAGQALGASWSPPAALTSSGDAYPGAIAALGQATAIAVYRNSGKIMTRRTLDSGATWRAPSKVSKAGYDPAIAGMGSDVDVVWTQHRMIHYKHSANGGVTYGPAIELGYVRVCPPRTAGCPGFPGATVARGAGGLVVVTWLDSRDDEDAYVYARISANGGASFGSAKTIAVLNGGNLYEGPVVAIGTGVILVAYMGGYVDQGQALLVRRSTDGGASWSLPTSIADDAAYGNPYYGPLCELSITAVGSHAYLAYVAHTYDEATEAETWRVAYSRTIDLGVSWSLPAVLSSGDEIGWPSISLKGGIVRVVFSGWTGSAYASLYRQSANGTTWTSPEVAASDGAVRGVVYAARSLVLYGNYDSGNVFVTTRVP